MCVCDWGIIYSITCVKWSLKIDTTKILMTTGSLMKVESIAGAFCNTFGLSMIPKGDENIIYTIVKGRETFYCRHAVPLNSHNGVNMFFKSVSFGRKSTPENCKCKVRKFFLLQTNCFGHFDFISDPLMV